MKRALVLLTCALLVMALCACASQNTDPTATSGDPQTTAAAESTSSASSSAESQIADYELVRLSDGETVKLSTLLERTTLVNFWASWCVYCVEEMPDLVEIDGKDDVRVIFINTDDSIDDAKKFLETNNYDIEVYIEPQQRMAKDFGIRGLPTTLFVGKERELFYIQPGLIDMELYNTIQQAIDDYIAQRSKP